MKIDDRASFEAAAKLVPTFDEAQAWGAAVKAGDLPARLKLAAAFVCAAFAAPEHNADLYDAAAAGWFGAPIKATRLKSNDATPLPLSEDFWNAFWSVFDARTTLDAGGVTMSVAALGACVSPEFQQRAALSCGAYPGVDTIDVSHMPPRVKLEDLAQCPQGSLGNAFYRLITDNKFDLEVLDRDALGLRDLTPPLNYLNTRILQAHDLWHIIGGYDVTKLHEIAISSFQLAQFGHSYSAMFLAFIATVAAFGEPAGYPLAMETIFSAWKHGRETAPMMLIPWEDVWHRPAQDIRADYGVTAYHSPFPADILEQLEKLQA